MPKISYTTKVKIDGKTYNSLKEGAKALGIAPGALYARLNTYKHRIDGHTCEYADKEKAAKVQNKYTLNPLIKELQLTKFKPNVVIRISNVLNNDKIYTIEELTKRNEWDMLKTPNFGKKCLEVLKKAMAKRYLSFTPIPHLQEEIVDSIDQLELSVRAYNAFKNHKITKISQLLKMTREDFMKIPNFGKTSFKEVSMQLNALSPKFLEKINKGE